MSAANYDESLRRLLKHEGGYTNNKDDPGGPTNFGITIFDYRKYVKPKATAADVRAMQLSEAQEIYRAKYWDALCCDDLPSGIDYSVFDYGVNSGVGRSGKVLRRGLGLDSRLSIVTPDVIDAANTADAKAVVTFINDERLRFLKGLRTWRTFGVGWGRRVEEVKAYSLQIAEDAPQSVALIGKAYGDDGAPVDDMGLGAPEPKPLYQSKIAVAATGAGGLGVANSVATDPTFTQLAMDAMHKSSFWLAAGMVILAGYIIYCRWHDHGRGAL